MFQYIEGADDVELRLIGKRAGIHLQQLGSRDTACGVGQPFTEDLAAGDACLGIGLGHTCEDITGAATDLQIAVDLREMPAHRRRR